MDRRSFVLGAAAAPFALRSGSAWAGARPLALVTADLESHVVVFDPATGRVVRAIPTAATPRSIETIGRRLALVAHTDRGVLSVVDARRVQAVVEGFAQPRYTAAHPNERLAYVTDSKSGEVVVVDVLARRIVRRTVVGHLARHVSLAADARTLWIALGSKAERLAVVDVARPEHPRVVRVIAPPFLAHDVGFEPGGRRVWVTSGDARALAVYDARSGKRFWWTRADEPPQHVTFARGVVYVASGGSGTVRTYALTGRLLRTATVPVGSYNVQHAWGRVLTPSLQQGTISVLDERGVVLRRQRVARSSHDACFVLA